MELQPIVDFFFPPQCGACETLGTGACERCLPYGRIAHRKLQTLHVTALAAYEGNVRRVVLALKSGRRDVARSLSRRLSELVGHGDVLVPVPTTRARKRERGFDGCELMAQTIARATGVAVLPNLVQVAGDRQRGRNRDARLMARGRFAWRGLRVDGVQVTLLDDVVTTGATLEDCAAALRAAGAKVEKAIAIASA
jgi:ComF family protein